ncbi:MAG: hypothetical protein WC273_12695 [Dehalococcoidia bacterium]
MADSVHTDNTEVAATLAALELTKASLKMPGGWETEQRADEIGKTFARVYAAIRKAQVDARDAG